MNPFLTRFGWVGGVLAAWIGLCPGPVEGQDPDRLLQTIAISGESLPLARKLQAADALVRPDLSAEKIARALSSLTSLHPLAPVQAAVGLLLDQYDPGKWTEAREEYQRLLAQAGDALVVVSDGPATAVRSVQVRRLCHMRLAAAPPSVRAAYRRQVDAAAEKLYQEGRRQRDPRPLRRLVDEFFCSRWGEPALDLLGDLAFERGDFAEALHWWLLLAPPASTAGAAGRLVYPEPALEVARVRAKQILAWTFAGMRERARQEFQTFQALHAKAQGSLAGRKGPYPKILAEFLSPLALDDESWTTYAGHPARHKQLRGELNPRLWAEGPAWRVRLIDQAKAAALKDLNPSQRAGRFGFHPLILPDRILVGDGPSVRGYDLATGRQLFRFTLKEAPEELPEVLPQARWTLSAAGRHIFARLGALAIGPGKEERKTLSHLICLEIPKAKEDPPIREVWRADASALGGDGAVFEGAPLIYEERAYLALSRIVGNRTQSLLACLDAASGKPRWLREVCETPEFVEKDRPRFRPLLVTLAGSHVVYCTHSGAVVAVDRHSGQRCWAVRYPPRARSREESRYNELGPCLYHDQRVFVAPGDSNLLLCLDVFSGRTVWEREMAVVGLLGIAGDRLLCVTPTGIRAVAASSGLDQGGWMQPAEGRLTTFGRGLRAGPHLLWPTADPKFPCRILDIRDGSQAIDPTRLRRLLPGNMAYAHGCLAVAGVDELVVYREKP